MDINGFSKRSSFNALRSYARSGVTGRLAVVILLHTTVTFFAVWALYSNPGGGANARDLASENSLILQLAEEAARSTNNQTESLHNLLVETPRLLPQTLRQALYRIKSGAPDSDPETIVHWEDDVSAGARTLERDRQGELEQVWALADEPPGSVVRITDNEYEITTCYAITRLPGASGEEQDTYIYSIARKTSPPVLEGRRFTLALIVVFAATALLALLIITLLQNKISRPLSELQDGLKRLVGKDGVSDEPVVLDVCSTCSIGDLMASFNEMSMKLHEQRRQLLSANEEIQKTAHELLVSKRLLETTVECAPDAIIVASENGDIEYFNQAGRNLFGYDGDPAPTYVNDLFVQEVVAEEDDLRTYEMKAKRELLGVRADGEQFPALVISAPLRMPGESISGLVFLIRDISESESYREMISRLDQLSVRGEMAGDIAHEINNFLAIVQGNVELLPTLIESSNSEKITKRLNAINGAVKRITDFTTGLMRFEPRELAIAPENPNQLIHNLLSFLKPQKRLRHVRIELRLSNANDLVPLDGGLIQQVLVNLIYNSADALSDVEGEKRIVISTEYDRRFRIIVSDNGPGIPQQYLRNLFNERFTTKRKGNGIGLVTCARIARAHNGEIKYESSPEGGARFVLEIPLTHSGSTSGASPARELGEYV